MTKLATAATIDRFWALNASWADAAAQALGDVDAAFIRESSEQSAPRSSQPGVAVIEMCGPMTKKAYGSFFSGCSTLEVRRSLRVAERDPAVKSISLVIDSPGGSVDGTADLADDVARISKTKPITAYVDGMCCSAALWVASQASRIVANPNALCVGSIGTFGMLFDTSVMYENAGVKSYLIASGTVKGHPAPGVEIPEAVIAEYQGFIEHITDRFVSTVASGREMEEAAVRDLATGATWTAQEALAVGLVDELASWDEFISGACDPDEGALALSTAEAHQEVNILGKFFKPGKSEEGSTETEIEARQVATIQALAETMATNFVTAKLATLKADKKLTPERSDALGAALMAAIKADGGGAIVLGETNVHTGDMVEKVLALADCWQPIDIDVQTIASNGGVVIVEPDDKAKAAKAAEKNYRKATPKSLKDKKEGAN